MNFDDWWGAYPTQEDYEANCRDAWDASAVNHGTEIESLRQQLSDEFDKREALDNELAHREAQIVRLREALAEYATDESPEGWTAIQALAATDDLSGYILCERKPRAWSWENKNVKGNWYLSWREPEPGFNKTPLYRAKERVSAGGA